VGGIGTQTVFGDDALEVGVVLAQLGNEAFRRIAFTIIFGRAILFDHWFGGYSLKAGQSGVGHVR
jgi:hypothetical protein